MCECSVFFDVKEKMLCVYEVNDTVYVSDSVIKV